MFSKIIKFFLPKEITVEKEHPGKLLVCSREYKQLLSVNREIRQLLLDTRKKNMCLERIADRNFCTGLSCKKENNAGQCRECLARVAKDGLTC